MKGGAASTAVKDYDPDFLVVRYICHDSSVRKSLRHNIQESEWKVQCRDSKPLNIKLHVDKSILHSTQVQIICNDELIFPQGGSSKSRIFTDFEHTWPFLDIVRGIGEQNLLEMKLRHFGKEEWFPAVASKQRKDGFFEVMATRRDPVSGRVKEEFYSTVSKHDLRVAGRNEPFKASKRSLALTVPKSNPLHSATLSVDGGGLITHCFGRPTPPANFRTDSGMSCMTIALEVSKNRQKVTANVGHTTLMNTLRGEAKAIRVLPTRPGKLVGCGSKRWELQIGQAEHVIEIERRWKGCKVVTLRVDGDILVEAAGEDLGCKHGMWDCSFHFVKEATLEWTVYETNIDGYPLDSRGDIIQRLTFAHHCNLSVANLSDLSAATLVVDNTYFNDLPLRQELWPSGTAEMHLPLTPQVMSREYGIFVPYRVNRNPTSTAAHFVGPVASSAVYATAHYGRPRGDHRANNPINNGGGLFAACACCEPEEEIQLVSVVDVSYEY